MEDDCIVWQCAGHFRTGWISAQLTWLLTAGQLVGGTVAMPAKCLLCIRPRRCRAGRKAGTTRSFTVLMERA